MKSVFPRDFYFWMFESLFLSQILSKFRPAQPYVFVVQERWAGECPLPFGGSVLASLTVALYDRGGGDRGRQMEEQPPLPCRNKHMQNPLVFLEQFELLVEDTF